MLRVAALIAVLCATARAETRGVVRAEVLPLSLTASGDTPLFGDRVDHAISSYNRAASARGEDQIDTSAVSVNEMLYIVAPGVEADAGHYLFRLEAPIGFANDMRSYGLGLYPLGLQAAVVNDIVVYGSAGGSASWLDRDGSGDRGGLVTARAALGARISRRFLAEVGYSAYAFGGSVNTSRLDRMGADASTPLPDPASVVTAGEARNLVDVSVGLSF
jgi:hypothetical protein